MLQRSGPTFVLVLAAFGLLFAAELVPKFPNSSIKELIAPPQYIKHMSFGYHESLADTIWIRAIQDFDQCGEGGLYRNRMKKIGPNQAVYDLSPCEKGWLYQMLNAVINLAPDFRSAYLHGATVLSILVNDHEGAKLIFDEAIKRFPKDGMLAYRAAYHYLIELKNPQRAADLLVIAGQNGAPQWVFSLAGRLYQEQGQLEFARNVLISVLESYKDEDVAYVDRLKERLEKIERDLAALKNSPVKPGKSSAP